MVTSGNLNRRQLLTGMGTRASQPGGYHISSAVVRAIPTRIADVVRQIETIEGVDVVASEAGKIVLVMEGASSGELGERLTAINLLEGVIAASMVFEHVEREEHDDPRTDSS